MYWCNDYIDVSNTYIVKGFRSGFMTNMFPFVGEDWRYVAEASEQFVSCGTGGHSRGICNAQ